MEQSNVDPQRSKVMLLPSQYFNTALGPNHRDIVTRIVMYMYMYARYYRPMDAHAIPTTCTL